MKPRWFGVPGALGLALWILATGNAAGDPDPADAPAWRGYLLVISTLFLAAALVLAIIGRRRGESGPRLVRRRHTKV